MSDRSRIEWTDATWNPIVGCTPISAGCDHCYAARMAKRLAGRCGYPKDWSKPTLRDHALGEPFRWRKPRRIFVCSMGDLFHPGVQPEHRMSVFNVMRHVPRHTFMVLTKRPENITPDLIDFPPNVWLGVTAENQEMADERIPELLRVNAPVRFVSAEPLLGPLDLSEWLRETTTIHISADVEGMIRNRHFAGLTGEDGRELTESEAQDELFALHARGVKYISAGGCDSFDPQTGCPGHKNPPKLGWVIVGGETGPGARPMHPDWVRSIRDQCQTAGVPFFLKGWGEWYEAPPRGQREGFPWFDTAKGEAGKPKAFFVHLDGTMHCFTDAARDEPGKPAVMVRVGKRRAGRLLDGREWNEIPEVTG